MIFKLTIIQYQLKLNSNYTIMTSSSRPSVAPVAQRFRGTFARYYISAAPRTTAGLLWCDSVSLQCARALANVSISSQIGSCSLECSANNKLRRMCVSCSLRLAQQKSVRYFVARTVRVKVSFFCTIFNLLFTVLLRKISKQIHSMLQYEFLDIN